MPLAISCATPRRAASSFSAASTIRSRCVVIEWSWLRLNWCSPHIRRSPPPRPRPNSWTALTASSRPSSLARRRRPLMMCRRFSNSACRPTCGHRESAIVNALPLTSSAKVDRRRLLDLVSTNGRRQAAVAARDETERALARICAERPSHRHDRGVRRRVRPGCGFPDGVSDELEGASGRIVSLTNRHPARIARSPRSPPC